jgi:hypothetical protein
MDQVPRALEGDRVKPSLKEVSVQVVTAVKPLRVSAVEPMHARGKIRTVDLDDHVVVVRHQAVAEASPRAVFDDATEELQESIAVAVILEEALPAVAARGEVIDAASDLNA